MKKIVAVYFGLSLASCSTPPTYTSTKTSPLPTATQRIVEETMGEIRQAYAPDKRVAIFKVEPAGSEKPVVLRGETNLPEAKKAFLDQLTTQRVSFLDSIQPLPAVELGALTYGVVTVSVASIRSEPREAAELATQATLGTPVQLFKKQGSWCLVQTPDDYISWADIGAVAWMNQQQFTAWQKATKLIYLIPNGYAYAEPNASAQVVSDLVGGSIMRLISEKGDFYQVAYPDGREGFVAKSEAKPYGAWLSSLQVTEQSLVNTAKKMMGLPYLWGGTSFKAVDCSGFTKTIYFMNGLILPRDASQQVHTGQLVDISQGFDQLHVGDLLFFGKPATESTTERVTHVGMWIGNNEFIHASSHVRVSSVDQNAHNYDEFNLKRLLRVKRILNNPTGNIVQLSTTKVY